MHLDVCPREGVCVHMAIHGRVCVFTHGIMPVPMPVNAREYVFRLHMCMHMNVHIHMCPCRRRYVCVRTCSVYVVAHAYANFRMRVFISPSVRVYARMYKCTFVCPRAYACLCADVDV